ncbi:hypothetical protein B0H14DRAFT_3776036 [Mycena olivaceomarginata]|nr:hypothetical protein B0H14DRAFT_3776036 [Mycena olivaceomarginata]
MHRPAPRLHCSRTLLPCAVTPAPPRLVPPPLAPAPRVGAPIRARSESTPPFTSSAATPAARRLPAPAPAPPHPYTTATPSTLSATPRSEPPQYYATVFFAPLFFETRGTPASLTSPPHNPSPAPSSPHAVPHRTQRLHLQRQRTPPFPLCLGASPVLSPPSPHYLAPTPLPLLAPPPRKLPRRPTLSPMKPPSLTPPVLHTISPSSHTPRSLVPVVVCFVYSYAPQ